MRHLVILASVLVAAPAAAGSSRETRERADDTLDDAPADVLDAVIRIGHLTDG
jgi:hypothetical protein